ncbi:MAG TPA: hypothetical protein VJS30_31520 [Paraburkholderia sp.]|nr:hypothetical protein [Paraburkholderia sp.]
MLTQKLSFSAHYSDPDVVHGRIVDDISHRRRTTGHDQASTVFSALSEIRDKPQIFVPYCMHTVEPRPLPVVEPKRFGSP